MTKLFLNLSYLNAVLFWSMIDQIKFTSEKTEITTNETNWQINHYTYFSYSQTKEKQLYLRRFQQNFTQKNMFFSDMKLSNDKNIKIIQQNDIKLLKSSADLEGDRRGLTPRRSLESYWIHLVTNMRNMKPLPL